MHVFAYVGSEDANANNKLPACQGQNEARSFLVSAGDPAPDLERSFQLQPGERRGWWSMHPEPVGQAGIAIVNGAVCDRRVRILLDSGSSTSMVSLDLARKLGLQLKFGDRLKVNGIGGVVTYATARTRVKVTLGMSVAYFFDLWAGNIGEGIDCLLGLDFMVRAGVRLCAYEGSVRLPDEECIPLAAPGQRPKLPERASVNTREDIYLPPGRSALVPARPHDRKLQVWACRHDNWLTTVVTGSGGQLQAVRVTNVSSQPIMIPARTPVAHLVEEGHLPLGQRCARLNSTRYLEWQVLVYEGSHSSRYIRAQDESIDAYNASLPPAVVKPTYDAPTKILSRGEVELVPGSCGGASDINAPPTTSAALVAPPSMSTFEVASPPPQSVFVPKLEAPVSPTASAKPSLPAELTAKAGSAGEGVAMLALEAPEVGDPNLPQDRLTAAAPVTPANAVSSQVASPVLPKDPSDTGRKLKMGMKLVQGRETRTDKPTEHLARTFKLLVTQELDSEAEATTFYQEGIDSVMLDKLRDQLAVLPDHIEVDPLVDIATADVGEPGSTTQEEDDAIRRCIEKHRSAFLGSGNALPPPARDVVCDIEVEPGTRPVAEKPRRIKSHLLPQVYELLKKLLDAGIIEYSDSEWASPIVIVMKKNGVDIRLCIDYRRVNQLIQLMNYPLPLIDDLLDNFEKAMWFLSLDMASGFWAVLMTQRAKHISAFVCPLGHFQWIRMPFGLKNAPLIYQKVIDNALWGYVRLPPHLEAEVEPEVIRALGLEPVNEVQAAKSATEKAGKTVFDLNIAAPECLGPVLGRSSYIDDIAYGAPTLGELLQVLDQLLYRLRYWQISVSLPKSSFGKHSIQYLSHEVNQAGIVAAPKIAKGLLDLPFPTSLKAVQSFLGSLNYYNKFIEDYAVIASVLYELSDERIRLNDSLDPARRAFELLKSKLLNAPLLKHPDRTKPFVIIPHANEWAIGAVLGQEHDGIIAPVRFTGRTLHDAELNYHLAEKEILALLRVLNVYYTLVAGQELIVYTRYSTLKWILTSKSVQGRTLQWAALLSPWTMDVRRVDRDQDGLAAIVAASITPREVLDQVAAELVPSKAMRVKPALVSMEMLDAEYEGLVLSFDGAAKRKSNAGSASFVIWRLPGWQPLFAKSIYLAGVDVTVNVAEYTGLLQGLEFLRSGKLGDPVKRIVVVGDSRIAVQQCQGVIGCNQPHLTLLLARFHELRTQFESVELIHVVREYNGAADYLAGLALRSEETRVVTDEDTFNQLRQFSRLPERLMRGRCTEGVEGRGETAQGRGETAQEQDGTTRERGGATATTSGTSSDLPASGSATVLLAETRSQRRRNGSNATVEVRVSPATRRSQRLAAQARAPDGPASQRNPSDYAAVGRRERGSEHLLAPSFPEAPSPRSSTNNDTAAKTVHRAIDVEEGPGYVPPPSQQSMHEDREEPRDTTLTSVARAPPQPEDDSPSILRAAGKRSSPEQPIVPESSAPRQALAHEGVPASPSAWPAARPPDFEGPLPPTSSALLDGAPSRPTNLPSSSSSPGAVSRSYEDSMPSQSAIPANPAGSRQDPEYHRPSNREGVISPGVNPTPKPATARPTASAFPTSGRQAPSLVATLPSPLESDGANQRKADNRPLSAQGSGGRNVSVQGSRDMRTHSPIVSGTRSIPSASDRAALASSLINQRRSQQDGVAVARVIEDRAPTRPPIPLPSVDAEAPLGSRNAGRARSRLPATGSNDCSASEQAPPTAPVGSQRDAPSLRAHEPVGQTSAAVTINPVPGEGSQDAFEGANVARLERVRAHQDADPPTRKLRAFLAGDMRALSRDEVAQAAKVADQFVLDEHGVLRYVSLRPGAREKPARLVVPTTLRKDVLHHCHVEFQGGHQGITRTYERVRSEYYWTGMYQDVVRFCSSCVDCSTGKGLPANPGPSPGNIQPEYPFHVVSMDFVLPLPPSEQGSTALLLFQCMFTGFVMCKAMSDTSAPAVARAYDEVVFQRFGASSIIRHDQDPVFMSEVFAQFRSMLGSQQRATLAYRPQANGQQERSVQTVARSIKSYVMRPGQDDWEDVVYRLMFAINTSVDATRRDTPFFLAHGWDAKSTVAAMIAQAPRKRTADRMRAYVWRIKIQREYQYALAWARDLQAKAKRGRAERQTAEWEQLPDSVKTGFEVGDAVWLYLARVKPGLAKKLAHHWHGPFRIVEKANDHRVRLKTEGTMYKVNPWVHISRLKPRLFFEDRPKGDLEPVPEDLDWDAALLPEDSWAPDEEAGEYEMEKILDVRWNSQRTRSGNKKTRDYLVKFVGYDEPEWIPVAKIKAGRLLYEFDNSRRAETRFAAMQSGDGEALRD